jgi:hypothetical protein
MRRLTTWLTLMLVVAVAAPAVHADIKKREKTTFKMEGMLGAFVNRMAGGSDGIESTMTLKGNRLATITGQNGQIVDLAEERIYNLDMRRKEYTVMTFAEMREQMEKVKADAKKRADEMKPEEKEAMQQMADSMEVDVKVDETGQTKSIAGQQARQVILTLTARQKGQTLEAGGGFVMTNDMWLGPAMPEMRELMDFQLKFMKAVYGEDFFADMQRMAGVLAMLPAFGTLTQRMQAESRKLEGYPLASTMVLETVRSEEQLKAAQSQQSTGGGISGALARRMMGNRGQAQPRSKTLTTTSEVLSVGTSATDADVAIPAGFKEKK